MSFPVSAASYSGYVRNWWVEENADLTWYFLNQDNSAWVTGLCGAGVYRLKVTNANYGVVNDINYVFAGTGMPVAMALAYDAQQIRKVLENPSLPAQVGAANREQMLRTLGVAVSSDYPRLERNLKQFALGIIEFQNVTPGQAELQYIVALFQLGAMIPWDRLDTGTGRGAGIGRKGQL